MGDETRIITPNAARRAKKTIKETLVKYRSLRLRAVEARQNAREKTEGNRVVAMEDAERLVVDVWALRADYWRSVKALAASRVELGAAWSPNALARLKGR